MTDLTPPPEQPMDDETRARIRGRLAEATDSPPSSIHRWVLPVVAAAAVLLIAFGGAYAAFWPGDDGASGPAPGTQESTPPDVETSVVPTKQPTLRESEPPTSGTDTGGGFHIARTTCGREVAQELPGAEQVVAWPLPDGEVGIWVAGDRAALCEDSGGIATVHGARPFPAPYPLTHEALGFSSSHYPAPGGGSSAYVAGGALPEGVTGISYTWPDGHVETARIKTDAAGRQWWAIGYVPTDGPMTKEGLNFLDLDPVQVDVALSGAIDHATLKWGHDDCAQVNNGC